MSISLMNAAWKSRLPAMPKMVLLALCDSANDLGECYPRMRTLAQKSSMNERTVQRHISAMESVGLISREIRIGRASLYSVNLEKLADAESFYADNNAADSACGKVGIDPGTVSPPDPGTVSPPDPGTVSPPPRHSVTHSPAQCHPLPGTVSPHKNHNYNRKVNVSLSGADRAELQANAKAAEKKFDFRCALIAAGVEPGAVRDWIAARNKKQAANTEAAFNRFKREAEKAGVSLQFAAQLNAENSWISADADLLRKKFDEYQKMQPEAQQQPEGLQRLGKTGQATYRNAQAVLQQLRGQ